MKRDDKIGH
ncbi:Protein of unknown function [Bacillus cereus]|nr:Protein of unknown function [Bacillus cereus]